MTAGLLAALVDGRPARRGALARLRRRSQRLLVSRRGAGRGGPRATAAQPAGSGAPNAVALISPSGGVGKSTCTFLIANLLASHLKLRVVAVDVNPGFGSLAQLVPDSRRSGRGLNDLLADAERLLTASELGPYVARLRSGLSRHHGPRGHRQSRTRASMARP